MSYHGCELTTIDDQRSGIVVITAYGDTYPHGNDCALRLGPARVAGPLPLDVLVRVVEDPILATELRAAYAGINPRNEYHLETTRDGVHISALQYRSGFGGVMVELELDACARVTDDEPEVRKVGQPLKYTMDGVYMPDFLR